MNLIKRDLNHIWHPCSQMKDYLVYEPIIIESANGSYITLTNGNKIIDGISSWWCKSLGHGHPRLKSAMINQINKFEHVIQANTTHETIVQLSEKLASFTSTLKKIFYTSSGSNAVEIAMKISIHSRTILGQKNKNKFISLKNGYHGETIGTMSISDLEKYKLAYKPLLFESYLINNIPYVNGVHDTLWDNVNDQWKSVEQQLNPLANSTTAIIVEPIVQGAGGMKIYSKHFLKNLKMWCEKNDVHLIADEIMTGIGRTGKMFAFEHADIEPDFICLGKGLSSGWLPFSAVLTTDKIYNTFYDDHENGNSFFHSETFCGNPLGAAIALETLKIIEDEQIFSNVHKIEPIMLEFFNEIALNTGKLENIRSIGAIVAADLIPQPGIERIGFKVALNAIKKGALLRPLDNTLYWLPPLNITLSSLEELFYITQKSIEIT